MLRPSPNGATDASPNVQSISAVSATQCSQLRRRGVFTHATCAKCNSGFS